MCFLSTLVLLSALPALPEVQLELDGGTMDGGVLEPPKLLADSPAEYPPELAGSGEEGEVRLQVTVDETGEVSVAEVESFTNDAFAREALHAAVKLRFSPALLDGSPRAVQLTFSYRFEAPAPVEPPPVEEPRVVVTGQVRQRGNRQPIPLARLMSDDGAVAETAFDGRFRLEVKPGARAIHVSATNFKPGDFKEQLAATATLDVVYGLTPERINPFETIVRADRERTELSRVELRDAEIRDVPGTLGDPFRVVMLMPGVSSVVSGIAYPVVRGSSPASTGYFLDGVRVPQLFHVFLGPAVVHPDFIEGIDFYAGGAPVKYGRLLGGVIEGKLTHPRDDGLHASAYADLLNAGAFLTVPFLKTDTRITVAGRVSYTGLMVGAVSPLVTGPGGPRIIADFWDYQARVEQGFLGGHGQLFAFGSGDAFGSHFDDAMRESSVQSITFHRVDARYRHPLGKGELEAAFTFGRDQFGFDTRGPAYVPETESLIGTQQQLTGIGQTSFTTRAGWKATLSDSWRVTTGASWDDVRAGFTQQLTFTPLNGLPTVTRADTPTAVANLFAGWADATFTGVPKLSVTAGVRLDHFHLVPRIDQTSADPRVMASYEVSERLTLRAAVGEFHQPPTFLISLPVVDVASIRYGLQDVVQTSAGATWKPWRDLELSADAYLNPMIRTLELGVFDDERVDYNAPLDSSSGNTPQSFIPPAPGSRPGLAYGLDLMARWPMKDHWFGWLTLSLQRSTRLTHYTRYDEFGRRAGELVADLPYAFDQSLVANAVVSYRFDNGVSAGVTLHFNTGRPESGQFGSRTRVPGVDDSGRPAWLRLSRDQVDRLPPYFRVDVRVAKTWLFDNFALEAWLDVLNATASGEVVSYTYDRDAAGNLAKLPTALPIILPNLGVKARY